MAMTENNPRHVAVFVDFENLALANEQEPFDIWRVIDHAATYGRVILRRAYADWRHYSPVEFKLVANNVDLIQVYSRGMQRKNGADIRLSVDAMETLITHPHLAVYVLAASDSDYTGLILKLREHGKFVVGVGSSEAHSEHFRAACDAYFLYSELGGSKTEVLEKVPFSEAKELLLAVLQQQGKEHPQLISQVQKEMVRLAPAFSVQALGFESFLDFLHAHEESVRIISEGQLHYAVLKEAPGAKAENGDPVHLQDLAVNPAYWRELLREKHKIQLAPAESLPAILQQFWGLYGGETAQELSRAEMEERVIGALEAATAATGRKPFELEDLRRVDKLLYMAKAFYFPQVNFAVERPGPADKRRLHERIRSLDGLIYEFNLLVLTRLLQEHRVRKISPDHELLKQFLCPPGDGWTEGAWSVLYGEAMARAEQVLGSR